MSDKVGKERKLSGKSTDIGRVMVLTFRKLLIYPICRIKTAGGNNQ